MEKRFLLILREENVPENVMAHLDSVERKAVELAGRAIARGHEINLGLVRAGAALHDIGRSRTHGIRHAVAGAEILKRRGIDPRVVRITERHIGAGITESEVKGLGLPVKDYLPETLEEKIVAHADNVMEGGREVPLERTLERTAKKLGEGHPALRRMRDLEKEIDKLVGKK